VVLGLHSKCWETACWCHRYLNPISSSVRRLGLCEIETPLRQTIELWRTPNPKTLFQGLALDGEANHDVVLVFGSAQKDLHDGAGKEERGGKPLWPI